MSVPSAPLRHVACVSRPTSIFGKRRVGPGSVGRVSGLGGTPVRVYQRPRWTRTERRRSVEPAPVTGWWGCVCNRHTRVYTGVRVRVYTLPFCLSSRNGGVLPPVTNRTRTVDVGDPETPRYRRPVDGSRWGVISWGPSLGQTLLRTYVPVESDGTWKTENR